MQTYLKNNNFNANIFCAEEGKKNVSLM